MQKSETPFITEIWNRGWAPIEEKATLRDQSAPTKAR